MNSFKKITPVEAKKIMEKEKCKILDVRTFKEFEESHIYNAILLPLELVENNIEKVFQDKKEKILVYCHSGIKSKLASEIMVNKGYKNVLEFGGIIDWPFDVVQ